MSLVPENSYACEPAPADDQRGGAPVPPRAEVPVSPPQRAACRRTCHVLAVVICAAAMAFVWQVSGKEVTWTLDCYSDMNTLMSGENFAQHGFVNLRFLPVQYIGGIWEHADFYTHFPPLPNVVNGLIRVAGVENLSTMRIVCGAMFVAGMAMMYIAFAPVIGAVASVIGLGFAATTLYFMGYCTSVHQHAFNVLFVGAFFWLLRRGMDDDRPPRWVWLAAWAVLVLESLSSFEYIPYTQVFAWAYAAGLGKFRRRWKVLAILATAPVFGVALHLAQDVWAVGLDKFLHDPMGYSVYTQKTRWEEWGSLPGSIYRWSGNLFYWPWPAILAIGAGGLAMVAGTGGAPSGQVRRTGAAMVAAAAAPLGWYLAMPGHTHNHQHVASQLFPLAFLAMGVMGRAVVEYLFGRGRSIAIRVAAAVAAGVMLFSQVQMVFVVISPHLHPPTFMFEALGADALPEHVAFLHNCTAEAQVNYFLRRPGWRCPNWAADPFPQGIGDIQKRLPPDWPLTYYVYYGRGDRQPLELLSSTCEGKYLDLGVPAMEREQFYAILFDIRPLTPGYAGPRPSPEVIRRQKKGVYPPWIVGGFFERFARIQDRYGQAIEAPAEIVGNGVPGE